MNISVLFSHRSVSTELKYTRLCHNLSTNSLSDNKRTNFERHKNYTRTVQKKWHKIYGRASSQLLCRSQIQGSWTIANSKYMFKMAVSLIMTYRYLVFKKKKKVYHGITIRSWLPDTVYVKYVTILKTSFFLHLFYVIRIDFGTIQNKVCPKFGTVKIKFI